MKLSDGRDGMTFRFLWMDLADAESLPNGMQSDRRDPDHPNSILQACQAGGCRSHKTKPSSPRDIRLSAISECMGEPVLCCFARQISET